MKHKWTRLLLIGTMMTSLTLSACGGGGGGGGGSNDIASTAYTGERSKAYLDSDNAEALILGAYEGLDAENIIPLSLETSTSAKIRIENPYNLATLVEQTLLMAQPGNRVTMLDLLQPWELCNNYPNGYTTDTLKETNNGVQGDINFFNCNLGDSLDVIILDGKMTLSLAEEGNLIKASITMNPLHMFDGVDRYGLYGKIGATINEYDMTIGMTINMTLEEPSGRTYWLNNYKMASVEKFDVTGQHWGTELTISGRYYNHDHGYVDFVTEEVVFIPFNVFSSAYDGLIKFTGSNASHAYLWLGESQDDYCIKVLNDSGVVDIGTCAPWNGSGDTGGDTGGDTVTEKGMLAINEGHILSIGAGATDMYSFIPSVTGTYTIAITNSQSDLSWMLSKSMNLDDEEIHFCDNFLNASNEICTPEEVLIAGQEYYLFIDEWDNVSGTYTLLISSTLTDSGDTGLGNLTFQETTSSFSNLYFDNFGCFEGVCNIDIIISPTEINPAVGVTVHGRYAYLEMFFPSDSVNSGTYNWSTSETAGTFSDFSEIMTFSGTGFSFYEMTGGSVTITRNGTNYAINGSVTTTGGPATFSFSGPLSAEY